MADVKIELAVGNLKFSGEGPEKWIEAQLDKVLTRALELGKLKLEDNDAPGGDSNDASSSDGKFSKSLASYIKEKGADSNQTLRFLAVADWLRLRGEKQLTTAAVSKALSTHHQKRLSNPADCLNKNVGKGLCEKTGDGFFITPDGLEALGHK